MCSSIPYCWQVISSVLLTLMLVFLFRWFILRIYRHINRTCLCVLVLVGYSSNQMLGGHRSWSCSGSKFRGKLPLHLGFRNHIHPPISSTRSALGALCSVIWTAKSTNVSTLIVCFLFGGIGFWAMKPKIGLQRSIEKLSFSPLMTCTKNSDVQYYCGILVPCKNSRGLWY